VNGSIEVAVSDTAVRRYLLIPSCRIVGTIRST
jgi:hypothetical protein